MKTGRPASMRSRMIDILKADTSGVGMTHAQIKAAFGTPERGTISSIVGKARESGKIFALGHWHDTRYFHSDEQRQACKEATLADIAAVRAARLEHARVAQRRREVEYRKTPEYRKRAVERKRLARLKKQAERPPKPPKAAKPPAPPKPRHRQKPMTVVKGQKRAPAPVLMGRREKVEQKPDLPVVIPAHVRVQVIPTGKDYRYSVSPHFVGEFTQQWRELRK